MMPTTSIFVDATKAAAFADVKWTVTSAGM